MTPEQKRLAIELIEGWAGVFWRESGNRMAALLQELIDAPEPVPVAWRYEDAFGTHFTEDYSEISNIPGVLSFTALFAAPPHQSEQYLEMVRDIRLQVESEFASLLPGTVYMDQPDGGSPTVQEQVTRMARDAERWRKFITDKAGNVALALQKEIDAAIAAEKGGAA